MRPLRTAAALFAALAWAMGSVAAVLHEASTVHVVCDDHGHVLELEAGHVDAPVHDTLSQGEHDDHDHGCAFAPASTGVEATAQSDTTIPSVPPLALRPSVRPDAPRGPPLAFAPKTSPPSC